MLRQLIPMFYLLLVAPWTHAITVEAEGVALIYNRDLDSARQAAINGAAQQALLQAGAWVSSRQSVENGVLISDQLKVNSQGTLNNIQVLSEQLDGDQLKVRIRAEVSTEEGCSPNSAAQRYLKTAAIAGFPLLRPEQANRGGFANLSELFARELVVKIGAQDNLKTLDASWLKVHRNTATASSYETAAGAISDILPTVRDLKVQFIISGVVRDLSPYRADDEDEGNILRVWYDQLDPMGRQHLRNFAVDVFIHDGFTGALLFNRNYRVGGRWQLDAHQKTGFLTPAFLSTDYGQQVRKLISRIGDDVDTALRCEPFSTRILRTTDNRVTFEAGTVAGVRPGDVLQVFRRNTRFDLQQRPYIELEDTGAQVVVNEVHPLFATGNLPQPASRLNIQQDDLLMVR